MRPAVACFDSAFASECVAVPVSAAQIREELAKHYLGRKPGTVVFAMAMLRNCFTVGAITYSLPPRETAKRYGCEVWEMSRLWVDDSVPQNAETWLIAQSLRYIKRNFSTIGLIVTYADTAQGHTGTVYKAANFSQDGHTDDDRKTPRFDFVSVSGKVYGRAAHATGDATERRYRSKKIRFIYPLRKRAV